MEKVGTCYVGTLTGIKEGEYNNYQLFPGLSSLAADIILSAVDRFNNPLFGGLTFSDEITLEEALCITLKKIDRSLSSGNWVILDTLVNEDEVLNIIEDWREDFIQSLLMFRFSQDENVLEWVKLINSFNWEALGELFGLCGMISLNSLEKLLEIATPPNFA